MTDTNATKDASTDLRQPSQRHFLKPAIGTNQCLCAGCGEAFNSVTAFDRHQRIGKGGRTVCVYPGDITDRDGNPRPMVKNARGWWVTELRESVP